MYTKIKKLNLTRKSYIQTKGEKHQIYRWQ